MTCARTQTDACARAPKRRVCAYGYALPRRTGVRLQRKQSRVAGALRPVLVAPIHWEALNREHTKVGGGTHRLGGNTHKWGGGYRDVLLVIWRFGAPPPPRPNHPPHPKPNKIFIQRKMKF